MPFDKLISIAIFRNEATPSFARSVEWRKLSKLTLYLLRRPDIFDLKHESSIFRSFIQPCMWFWKCQTSSPEAKQYRV